MIDQARGAAGQRQGQRKCRAVSWDGSYDVCMGRREGVGCFGGEEWDAL